MAILWSVSGDIIDHIVFRIMLNYVMQHGCVTMFLINCTSLSAGV